MCRQVRNELCISINFSFYNVLHIKSQNVRGQTQGLGDTQYKRPYGDVPPTWVAKSASWYMNDPHKVQNVVYEWGNFSIFFLNLNKNWLKFKKIWEKSGDFAQNLVQNWTDWYMNGSLFLKNWYLYGSIFNSVAAYPYQNQTGSSRCSAKSAANLQHLSLTQNGMIEAGGFDDKLAIEVT